MKENETIEFKKSLAELKAGLISIVAMLNKHGAGELWFGIRNDGKAVGLEAGQKTLRDLSQSIAAHIEPKIFPHVGLEILERKRCIKVVFSGKESPYFAYGRAYMRALMENAKRTATDFLVPPAMVRAIKKAGAADAYQFWREFCPEEKFLLKGLEQEAQRVFKIGAFQDLGRAYGLSDYENLLGPTKANDTRTKLPEELPRPDAVRFDDVPASDRNPWRYSPLRHIYHALDLLQAGTDMDRAVKHLVDTTDFWNIRTTRLGPILSYLRETTAHLPYWQPYQDHLAALQLGVEHWKA